MERRFDRYSLRLFWILGLLAGATIALAGMGGCSTWDGVKRDWNGAWQGVKANRVHTEYHDWDANRRTPGSPRPDGHYPGWNEK